MAARAGIRFTTKGAGRTIRKTNALGAAFGGLGKKGNSAGLSIGRLGYRIYNSLARISMVSRGVRGMSREVSRAQSKYKGWGRAMAGPFTQVLAGMSKKFAEMRRTLAFYVMGIQDYVRWGKKAAGVTFGVGGGKSSRGVLAKAGKGKEASGGAISTAVMTTGAGMVAGAWGQATFFNKLKGVLATTRGLRGPAEKPFKDLSYREKKAAGWSYYKKKDLMTELPSAMINKKQRDKLLGQIPKGGRGVWSKEGEGGGVKPPPPGVINKFKELGKVFGYIKTSAKALIGVFAGLTVALTTLYTVVGYFTTKMAVKVVKGFMSIRETFRMYEISLGGIIRNTEATAKVMKFATKYAAEYPAMFEDVIDAFRGLASMPTLKPLFRKADQKDLKGIMDVVQGLATLKPQQGVQGAMMALREGLSGQMRSLRMRFEVNVREMAEAAGFSFTEITHDAGKALIAMRKFVELNVPAKAMASMAMTIGTQYGNLYDKYRTFVNEMMRSTGAYWAVVVALKKLNDWVEKVLKAPEVVAFAYRVGNSLRELVRVFEYTIGSMDWKEYLKAGDIVGAVSEFCDRVKVLFTALWDEFGPQATAAIRKVSSAMWAVFKPVFIRIASTFWTLLIAGANDAGNIIADTIVAAIMPKISNFTKGFTAKGKKGEVTDRQKRINKWLQPGKEEKPKIYKFKLDKEGKKDAETTVEKWVKAIKGKSKLAEKEPVDVGADIIGIENKRLKVMKMAFRQFSEWSDEYKYQKKDAEGLLAITKQLADVLNIVSLKKEKVGLAGKIDAIEQEIKEGSKAWQTKTLALTGKMPEKGLLSKNKKFMLLDEQAGLQKKLEKITDRIVKAGVAKAEDINKLLQTGIKSRDTILEKEKEIVKQIKEAASETKKLNRSMLTGMVSTVVSFFSQWKDGFRLLKNYASIMGKAMIPANLFGQGKKGVSWKEGLQKGRGEQKGVPGIFPALIDRIKGALKTEENVAGKKSYIESLLDLYKESMTYARGRKAKGGFATKAMELLPQLLSVQAEEAKLAMQIQQGQFTELKLLRAESVAQTTLFNTQIGLIQSLVTSQGGLGAPRASWTRASEGNKKITESNPSGHPFLGSI